MRIVRQDRGSHKHQQLCYLLVYIKRCRIKMCIGRKRCKVIAVDSLDNCSICLEPMYRNLYILECNHRFHAECGLKWVAINQHCPLCRRAISKDHILGAVVGYISR